MLGIPLDFSEKPIPKQRILRDFEYDDGYPAQA
jgi:hypothetical protein